MPNMKIRQCFLELQLKMSGMFLLRRSVSVGIKEKLLINLVFGNVVAGTCSRRRVQLLAWSAAAVVCDLN